jgi:hypothetical protein
VIHSTTSHPGSYQKTLLLMLGSVLVLRVATPMTANLSYVLIAAYALLGRSQAIQALVLSWLFSMLSEGIAAEATLASLGRYGVIAAAAMSVLARSAGVLHGSSVSRLTFATILLGGFFVVHSMLFSPIVDVSILKSISWGLTVVTLFAAWGGLSSHDRYLVASQIFYGLVVVMLFSLPLLAMPVGYLRNGTGFQGVLNQPQGFGPTIALLGAWAGGRVFSSSRPSWYLFFLAGICFVLVVLSESRTAGLGMVGGLAAAVLFAPLIVWRPVRVVMPGFMSRRVQMVAGAILLGSVMSGSILIAQLDNFISKGSRLEVAGLANAYEVSRGALINTMIDNINIYPFSGIGFGIGSNYKEMDVERDSILGLPISAAIEKGVLPVAVLEELGIFGTAAFLAWLWLLVRHAGRNGVTALALVFTTLILNFGESTFFSPGGFGLLPLILITWAGSGRSVGSRV